MAAPISTTYTPEEREKIVAHVIAELSGGRAVSRILREDDGMPERTTFWGWCSGDLDLANKVARAREAGVEALLDETLEIADDASGDHTNGEFKTEHVQRAKLRIESRREYARMIAPRKYGQKIDVTSGGEKLQAPNSVTIEARVETLILLAQQRRDAAGEGTLIEGEVNEQG